MLIAMFISEVMLFSGVSVLGGEGSDYHQQSARVAGLQTGGGDSANTRDFGPQPGL